MKTIFLSTLAVIFGTGYILNTVPALADPPTDNALSCTQAQSVWILKSIPKGMAAKKVEDFFRTADLSFRAFSNDDLRVNQDPRAAYIEELYLFVSSQDTGHNAKLNDIIETGIGWDDKVVDITCEKVILSL